MVYRCEVCGKEISLPYNKLGDFNSHPFYVIGMFDNKAICYSCLTEKYTYCNQCKSYHLTSDMVQIYNGEYVCKNCGQKLAPGSKFCGNCGTRREE